jgi:Fe-S-cluster containining protein
MNSGERKTRLHFAMKLKYPRDVLFECIRCGSCCRDTGKRRRKIVLTSADLESIAKITQLRVNEFCRASHIAPRPFRWIMRENYGACIFIGENSKCRIYDSRPMICRCYPFSVEWDETNMTFSLSRNECPGLGRGIKLQKQFFEKLAQEVISNFKTSEKTGQDSRHQ